jgi:hypothetical protein
MHSVLPLKLGVIRRRLRLLEIKALKSRSRCWKGRISYDSAGSIASRFAEVISRQFLPVLFSFFSFLFFPRRTLFNFVLVTTGSKLLCVLLEKEQPNFRFSLSFCRDLYGFSRRLWFPLNMSLLVLPIRATNLL